MTEHVLVLDGNNDGLELSFLQHEDTTAVLLRQILGFGHNFVNINLAPKFVAVDDLLFFFDSLPWLLPSFLSLVHELIKAI